MTSFNEGDVNRANDGKFAAKQTGETDASALGGSLADSSGPVVNMSYDKKAPFTPEVGQRIAVISRATYDRDVTQMRYGSITKIGKRDVNVDLDNGEATKFRLTDRVDGGYSEVQPGGGNIWRSAPRIYPADHPETFNALADYRYKKTTHQLRDSASSMDNALRNGDIDTARELHETMGRHLDALTQISQQRVEW